MSPSKMSAATSWRSPFFRHINSRPSNGGLVRCGRVEQTMAVAAGLAIFFLGLLTWGYAGAESLFRLGTDILPYAGANSAGASIIDLQIVKLDNAIQRGAVCLDGSPPGYYFQPGHGDGKRSWLVFLQGGGWCADVSLCAKRAGTVLGSSRRMPRKTVFQGILSNFSEVNPEFYNWNIVMVAYCDGASFAGDVENPVLYKGEEVYFRGQRIWDAVMDELLWTLGMNSASQALLAGCSAGGLATMLHCDRFKSLLPGATVKCLNDAGFFLDKEDIAGRHTIRSLYQSVFDMQGLRRTVDRTCLDMRSYTEQWQCFFPQHILRYIQTPLFVVNAFYDNWQISNVLAPHSADTWGGWGFCKQDPIRCTESQLETLNEFRASMMEELKPLTNSKHGGMFLPSCFIHCQTIFSNTWHGPTVPRINNKTMAEAVGDWFFDRRSVQEIDPPYPSNPTCFDWRHSSDN